MSGTGILDRGNNLYIILVRNSQGKENTWENETKMEEYQHGSYKIMLSHLLRIGSSGKLL